MLPDEELRLPKVPMISIVDDDEGVRKATSALVRSLGYAVATFASAEDFLESDRVDDTSCSDHGRADARFERC